MVVAKLLSFLLFGTIGSYGMVSNSALDMEMKTFVEKYNSTAASSYLADANHICDFGSYGFAQEDKEEPFYDIYGRSHMGSNTKSLSSVLVAILLENNLVRGQTNGWNTTLGSVFPDLAAGTPYEEMTLKALASMYAGFPDNTDFWAYWNAYNGTNLLQQREDITRDGFLAPPSTTPGTTFLYSNWGYVILGHVAEVSLNMTWEDALLQYLVLPLDMVPSSEGVAEYVPFGPPSEAGANWGHIYFNDSVPHFACDPNNPPDYPGYPDYQCDNCPNMGAAGTYSGGILNMSRYYFWTIQCAAGESTQNAVSLSQQGCQEIQQLYAPNDPDAFYGFGWAVSEVSDGAGGTTKMLSHAGSNNLWIVYVNVFPSLGTIAWAGSNSGRPEEDDMVHEIVAALPGYSFIDCAVSSGEEGNDDDSLGGGAIAGIVIGCLAAVVISLFFVHRSLSARKLEDEASQDLRRSLQP